MLIFVLMGWVFYPQTASNVEKAVFGKTCSFLSPRLANSTGLQPSQFMPVSVLKHIHMSSSACLLSMWQASHKGQTAYQGFVHRGRLLTA